MKNLLNNPGFEGLLSPEKIPTGWFTPPEALPVETDETIVHSGKVSIRIPGDRKSHALRQEVRSPKANAFTVGGYVRAEDAFFGPGEYAYIYGHIFYKGRPSSDATHFYWRIRPGTYSWHRVAQKGEAHPSYAIERVLVTCTAKFSSGTIWFDDMFLVESSWRADLARIGDEVEKLARRLDETSGMDVSEVRAQLAELRRMVAKSEADLPPPEGEGIVSQAREALARAYCSLTSDVYAAIWGRHVQGKSIEARVVFHGIGPENTKACLEDNLSKASSINANMLLPSVVGAYEAIYPSKILPVREGWQAPDALADLVSMAHERKIEVCPYIACFHPIAKEDISKSFYAEHQERLSVRHPKDLSADQRFPDPANPQVRQLLADVAAEIVSKYEVDGLGLDYIRYYDHQAMCYCTACRAAIRERFGFDPLAGNPVEDKSHWESLKEWRVEQITATVRAVRDAVKALKPGVKLYACVISDPDYARQGFGQDWADFAQYLDFIVPMNYGWVGLDEGLLRRQAQTLSGKTLFFPAIGGMPPEHAAFTPDDWITMINLARGVGAEGIAIYALRYIRPEVCALLRATAFKEPALLPTRGQ